MTLKKKKKTHTTTNHQPMIVREDYPQPPDANSERHLEETKRSQISKFSDNKKHSKNNGWVSSALADIKLGGEDPEKWWQRTRIHVALLGLTIAAVNCYAQATFCIAIVEMVFPPDYMIKATDTQPAVSSSQQHHHDDEGLSSSSDQSCPIEFKYRDYYDSWRFPTNGSNSSSSLPVTANSQFVDLSNRFAWDASQQGILLGAFAIGTAPLQVIGGRLAEIYGSKWVLLAGCLGTALTNLTIPYIAHFSYLMLVVNRVLMGIAQAGMEPGLMCLLAEWLTPSETGFFISMLLFAICIGFFLGSLCSSFILALGYGWPLAYYVSGGLNLLVALLWVLYADSSPQFSRYISPGELKFVRHEQKKSQIEQQQQPSPPTKSTQLDLIIAHHRTSNNTAGSQVNSNNYNNNNIGDLDGEDKRDISSLSASQLNSKFNDSSTRKATTINGANEDSEQKQAPWVNILTTRSVWAFIICKISIRWCADVFGNELPTYLANVLHLSIKFNGILNGTSSALFSIFSFTTGWLVNELLTNNSNNQNSNTWRKHLRVTNKTALRKAFQSVASFGSALAVFLMTYYDCSLVFSMSMLLVVSCCLVMGTGGELQIPYDMTSKYPGTLHGMACTLSVSGWLAPPLIGMILGDQPSSRYRWSIVWYLTAAINLIGGLVFVLFADASPRDFDSPKRKKKKTTTGSSNNLRPLMKNSNGLRCASSSSTETNPGGGDDDDGRAEGGYYNVACKSQDDSPAQTKRRDLSSTPIEPMLINENNNAAVESEARVNQQQQQQQQSAGSSSPYFDSKLIRVRQSEASFVRPKMNYFYPASLDSPLASCEIVFPFREKAAAKEQQTNLDNNKQTTIMEKDISSASEFNLSCRDSAARGDLESRIENNKDPSRPREQESGKRSLSRRRQSKNSKLKRLLSSFAYGNEESREKDRTLNRDHHRTPESCPANELMIGSGGGGEKEYVATPIAAELERSVTKQEGTMNELQLPPPRTKRLASTFGAKIDAPQMEENSARPRVVYSDNDSSGEVPVCSMATASNGWNTDVRLLQQSDNNANEDDTERSTRTDVRHQPALLDSQSRSNNKRSGSCFNSSMRLELGGHNETAAGLFNQQQSAGFSPPLLPRDEDQKTLNTVEGNSSTSLVAANNLFAPAPAPAATEPDCLLPSQGTITHL